MQRFFTAIIAGCKIPYIFLKILGEKSKSWADLSLAICLRDLVLLCDVTDFFLWQFMVKPVCVVMMLATTATNAMKIRRHTSLEELCRIGISENRKVSE